MRLTITVLYITTALVFLLSATMNLRAATRDRMPAAIRKLGISATLLRLAGTLELSACLGLLAGLVFLPFGIAAAAGLVLLMTGAIGYHLRVRDLRGALIGPTGPLLLSIATLTVGLAAL